MGTDELFQLLLKRTKEVAEQMRILGEENKRLKMLNRELIAQKERARDKVRELLNKLGLSDG